jgi:hypothetical protein
MNQKILTTFILSAILLTTFVAAEVLETNYVFDGDTNQVLTGVSVIMYTCQDEACDTATRLHQKTMNTGNDNKIVLTYPTELETEFGYMTYFFKSGYVPTKFPSDWAGNGKAGEYDNYLYKITDNAHAPIEDFEVSDKTIEANQNVLITANILSPRLNSDNVEFIPQELVADYYSDKVKITLEVTEPDGLSYSAEIETINMLWSTEQEIKYSWTPTIEGEYTLKITTEITDDKFLSTTKETQEMTIEVKGDDPTDDDNDNQYPTGYRSINQGDTTEDDAYLNQFNNKIISDDEQPQDTELSNWQKFVRWFNNLFYKVFWFLD